MELKNKKTKKKKKSVHEKAIRLVEGGIVEVDGHQVKLVKYNEIFDTCYSCKMDCLCYIGTEMCEVCMECHRIINRTCFLILNSRS